MKINLNCELLEFRDVPSGVTIASITLVTGTTYGTPSINLSPSNATPTYPSAPIPIFTIPPTIVESSPNPRANIGYTPPTTPAPVIPPPIVIPVPIPNVNYTNPITAVTTPIIV